MVAYPTVTPETSVMALHLPVAPSNGILKSRARVMCLSFCDLYQLCCDILHDFIRYTIHCLGLDTSINAIVDIIHDDKFFQCPSDLGREPIQIADGGDPLCNLVKRRELISVFILLGDR